MDPTKAFQQLVETLKAAPLDRNPAKKRPRKLMEKPLGSVANAKGTAAAVGRSRTIGEGGEGREGDVKRPKRLKRTSPAVVTAVGSLPANTTSESTDPTSFTLSVVDTNHDGYEFKKSKDLTSLTLDLLLLQIMMAMRSRSTKILRASH